MRSLAEFVNATKPEVLALCEVDAGDAFALATRFALGWAYRGAQALFWEPRFAARDVRDVYLPFVAARPFDRRGLLRVEGSFDGERLSLFATQFAAERSAFVPELRFARGHVRSGAHPALIFAQAPFPRVAFGGDCSELARHGNDGLYVFARGLRGSNVSASEAHDGIGATIALTVDGLVDGR